MTQTHTTMTGCKYHYLPQGIHEFVFTGEGNTGMDEFFAKLEEILTTTPHDQTLRYIVDTTHSKGQASIREMISRFKKLEAKITRRARGRTAILHTTNVLVSLADLMISTFAPGQDKTRFFNIDQRDDAIKWLLNSD